MSAFGRARRAALAAAAAGILAAAAAADAPPDGLVAAGRRLYREGRRPSGEPITAFVQGDVPVSGTQLTCQSCHRRSGMGAIESGRIVAPVAGPLLFTAGARGRPAYDRDTLARALSEGVDPTGRTLDPLMPRFRLEAEDVAALTAYLGQLGAHESPGVDPGGLRLATVIAGEVATEAEAAVLDVLRAYVADRNRTGPQRLRGGHVPGQPKDPFREWSLDVWRLEGPPSGWRAQAEERMRRRAPFAVVGGLARGTWQPIHDLCDAAEMPCLLPDVDLPPPEDEAHYSLYFTRGLHQEAEIVASSLVEEDLDTDLVVVGRPTGGETAALVRALERRGVRPRVLDLDRDADAATALGRPLGRAAVLWVDADGLRQLASGPAAGEGPLFLSSTILDGDWGAVPDGLRPRARVAHLDAPPGLPDPPLERFRAWARSRGLRLRAERHQAHAYFACLAFAEGAKHLARYPQRDYLLDLLDHASNLTAYLPLYPRAGLVPGQRVLSRGGYLSDLSGRREPVWVVP